MSSIGQSSLPPGRHCDSEWMARESRELEESKARAAQMEKTMKWWSDCTANWREKWIKVRNERNVARDEAKQLRFNLEAAVKESNGHKREKNELERQVLQLKKEIEKVHLMLMKHAGQFDSKDGGPNGSIDEPDITGHGQHSPDLSSDGLKPSEEDGLLLEISKKTRADGCESKDLSVEEYVLQNNLAKHSNDAHLDRDDGSIEEKRLIQQLSSEAYDDTEQKTTIMQIRLEEAQRTIELEREEMTGLHKKIDRTTRDLMEVKNKCEELRVSKQDAVRELLTIQEQHRAEMRISNNALQEEINAREALERRLCELRGELERLQTENAVEWGKRERLETDKIALERDNKKLRGELREAQDRLERRGRTPLMVTNASVNGETSDCELRVLQQELLDRNKEIADIKHSHNKMKKLLSEANIELGHAVRRAEQYETEVKRLRARVEELKRELAGAEDELDAACNQVRRLQRSNEELDPALVNRHRMSAPINLVSPITKTPAVVENPSTDVQERT